MNNNSIFEAFKHIDDTLINIDGIPNKKEIQLNKLNENLTESISENANIISSNLEDFLIGKKLNFNDFNAKINKDDGTLDIYILIDDEPWGNHYNVIDAVNEFCQKNRLLIVKKTSTVTKKAEKYNGPESRIWIWQLKEKAKREPMLPIYEDEHWSLYKPSNVSQAMSMRRGTNWDLYKYFNENDRTSGLYILNDNTKVSVRYIIKINPNDKSISIIDNNSLPIKSTLIDFFEDKPGVRDCINYLSDTNIVGITYTKLIGEQCAEEISNSNLMQELKGTVTCIEKLYNEDEDGYATFKFSAFFPEGIMCEATWDVIFPHVTPKTSWVDNLRIVGRYGQDSVYNYLNNTQFFKANEISLPSFDIKDINLLEKDCKYGQFIRKYKGFEREGNHKIIRKTRDFRYGADFSVIGEWEATATCTFTAKIKLK